MTVIKAFLSFMTAPFKIGGITFSFSLLRVLLRFFLPLLAVFIFYKLLLFLIRRLILKPLKIAEEIKDKIYRYTRLLLRIVVFLLLLFLITGFFESEIQNYITKIWEVLSSPFYSAGASRISIVTLILAIPIFYLASWLARVTKRFVDAAILPKLTLAESVSFTVSSLVRYGVMILAILVGLSMIGINLSSLAVLFGVLGIGVGFGLQSVVSNYISGLVIFFERPIKEGDRILVNGLEGDVVHIRLRSTIINTLTNETIVVPNSQLVGNSIHNYSYEDKRIVIINSVQVSYSIDLEQAKEVLLKVAERAPYALKHPGPEARVMAFQDSGILMELWTWIKDGHEKLAATTWVNMEIWREFKRAGIVIPFPQVDLHVMEPVNHIQLKSTDQPSEE